MPTLTIINVAVAVIHYQNNYLLGFRSASQHQGNRYEFVGGKVDHGETPIQALVREVKEEVGLKLHTAPNAPTLIPNFTINTAQKARANTTHSGFSEFDKVSWLQSGTTDTQTCNPLGRIQHDYGDKQVVLHVYRVSLTKAQYEHWQGMSTGREGQALTWVDRRALIDGAYPLPEANSTILQWLAIDDSITITHTLAYTLTLAHKVADKCHQKIQPQAYQTWLEYHQQHLAQQATVYIRHKITPATEPDADGIATLFIALASGRKDLKFIVSAPDYRHLRRYLYSNSTKNKAQQGCGNKPTTLDDISSRIVAQHLTQHELISLMTAITPNLKRLQAHTALPSIKRILHKWLDPTIAITTSCHDAQSIEASNRLALACRLAGFKSVVAAFVSPVHATLTHAHASGLGWGNFATLATLADMPVIALGGIAPTDLPQARRYGADKVAGIRKFMRD